MLHPDLPALVKQRYGSELRHKTIASIKPEISLALTSLLDELHSNEEIRTLRLEQTRKPFSRVQQGRSRRSKPMLQKKACPLCQQAGRPVFDHYLSVCPYLPKQDKKYMVRTRAVEVADDSDVNPSDEEEPSVLCTETTSFAEDQPPLLSRVTVRASPHLVVFHGGQPIRILLDLGAESSMIRADEAKRLGLRINPNTSQTPSQADGGQMTVRYPRRKSPLRFDALVVTDLASPIIAGSPFLEANGFTINFQTRQIHLPDGSITDYSPSSKPPQPRIHRITNNLLRMHDKTTTLCPNDYLELQLPAALDNYLDVALEPRQNSLSLEHLAAFQQGTYRNIAGYVRVPNISSSPVHVTKHMHLFNATPVVPVAEIPPDNMLHVPTENTVPTHVPVHKPEAFSSDTAQLDPDNILSSTQQYRMSSVLQNFDEVFNTNFPGYNGAVGPILAVVNIGPAQPPQRKGRLPLYGRNRLVQLQQKLDELKTRGVIAKYCKPQPSLLPNINQVLRQIACWKYIIVSDLTSAYHQIPLHPTSRKYCGIVTPFKFKGIRVYCRSAMGMPGSETALEEQMSRALGDLLMQGVVAKIADDLYCGGNSFEELHTNWNAVLRHCTTAHYGCPQPRLSSALPRRPYLVGTGTREPYQLHTTPCALATASPPPSVTALRSYIGSSKTLSRVIPGTSVLLGPLDDMSQWLPCELEALAITSALKHFKPYLIQTTKPAFILTDSKPCVEAVEKLRRGEFSYSPRVSTFLAAVSQFPITVKHIGRKYNLSTDVASRHPLECTDSHCQICSFVQALSEEPVINTATVCTDSDLSSPIYTCRSAWIAIQSSCASLRRVYAHLQQGTRPSKKEKNIADIKAYLSKLLTVCWLCPTGTCMDAVVQKVTPACDQCTAPKCRIPVPPTFTTEPPPQTIFTTFAADVMKRAWQNILVVRECSTSYTTTQIIPDETSSTLRDGLITLCTPLHLLDGPPATIRCDPAPGFQTLVKDSWLAENRLQIDIGEYKNINKNPVAERAIRKIREELCKVDPLGQPITPAQLAVVTAHAKVRSNGLSSREYLFQRDQFNGKQIPLSDKSLLEDQNRRRLDNHTPSANSKNPTTKFIGRQLRSRSYKVRLAECYLVPNQVPPHDRHPACSEEESESEYASSDERQNFPAPPDLQATPPPVPEMDQTPRHPTCTTHCLLDMTHSLFMACDRPNNICSLVSTDYSKAFDRVSHTVAICRLLELGLRPSLARWITDFLTSRIQAVRYHGATSDTVPVTCGLPQETLLGPLIFTAYINSAAQQAISKRWKFVDDLNLLEIRNPPTSPSHLQQDLTALDQWSKKSHDASPREVKAPHIPRPLTINNVLLQEVRSMKILGIHLQANMKWNTHVDTIYNKASQRLYLLRKLKHFHLPIDDLVTVYVTYIRPVTEYAAPVWHSGLSTLLCNKLEKVQRRALRIILGKDFISYSKACEQPALPTLKGRR
ncbi:hypothetical protein Bbelb_365160 [Branchiostoma belcheri]|nr:hypothetical protein Bbelb_365160 [Branchiostoma belcheri]